MVLFRHVSGLVSLKNEQLRVVVTLWSTQSSNNGTAQTDAKHDGLDNIRSISSDWTRRSAIDF